MKIRIVLISALLAGVFSINTFACGDSLYRVGKGVSYRVYTAPLPGSVLVYGQSEGAKVLAEALAAQVGIHAQVVDVSPVAVVADGVVWERLRLGDFARIEDARAAHADHPNLELIVGSMDDALPFEDRRSFDNAARGL